MSQETQTVNNDEKLKAFGARLKMEREKRGLDHKAAAANIRLNERVVIMLENGQIDSELPLTFLKGYLRLYAASLMIPDSETKQIIELLQPAVSTIDPALLPPTENDITSKNYRMQLASAAVGLTIVGLVGTWWHAHATAPTLSTTNAMTVAIPATATPPTPLMAPVPPPASPLTPPLAPPQAAAPAPAPATAAPLPEKAATVVIPPNSTTVAPSKTTVTPHPATETPTTANTKSVPVEDIDDEDNDASDNNTDNNNDTSD